MFLYGLWIGWSIYLWQLSIAREAILILLLENHSFWIKYIYCRSSLHFLFKNGISYRSWTHVLINLNVVCGRHLIRDLRFQVDWFRACWKHPSLLAHFSIWDSLILSATSKYCSFDVLKLKGITILLGEPASFASPACISLGMALPAALLIQRCFCLCRCCEKCAAVLSYEHTPRASLRCFLRSWQLVSVCKTMDDIR
jgi:hypothetical protein